MIRVTPTISIGDDEVTLAFTHSGGPGGQNVNKVATAVQLRFDAAGSTSLAPDVKTRLLAIAGQKANSQGVILISARRHRSQGQNVQDAMDRLLDMIRQAAHKPRPRRKTRPTAASGRRRIEGKTRRGAIKRLRGPVDES